MRWGFLWMLLVVLVVSRPALAHEPLEEARRRTVVPASRLDAMVRSLQKLLTWVEVTFGPDGTSVTPPNRVRLQCNAGALNTSVQCSGLAKPSCRLTIQLVDAATGKPTAARAFVRTEDGRYFVHDDRTVYLAGGKNIQTFGYEDSQFVAVVPPGPVHIKFQRGFEYELAERTEVVDADKAITMALTRWVDMPALGWFSGDTHEHWVTTEWYENRDPGWLAARTQAGSQMTWWGHDDVAHTGPIYVTAGDKRLVKPDAVDRLIEVVRAGRAAAALSNMYASEQQKAEVLKYFDEGIEKYQQLLAANGYTNVENYLNELAGDSVPGAGETSAAPAPSQ